MPFETRTAEVRSTVNGKTEVVATPAIPVLKTLDDMTQYFTESGSTNPTGDIFDLAYSQLETNIKNKARAEFNSEPSLEKRQSQAMSEFGELPVDQMQAASTAPGGLKQWLSDRSAAILAEWTTQRDARIASVKSGAGEATDTTKAATT